MTNSELSAEEQRIEELESSFAAAAGAAFSRAFDQAMQAGLSVVYSEDGNIYEQFPDGQRRLIKTIIPPSPAQPGQKYFLK